MHLSLFVLPDVKVYCQLGWPMLNDTIFSAFALFDRVMRCMVRVLRALERPPQRLLTWAMLTDSTL